MRNLTCPLCAGILMVAALASGSPGVAASVRHHKSQRRLHAVVKHESPGMSPARATEIQSALIGKGYLTGEPTGVWDPQTISAMQKLQSDNGWQSKLTPDARALNKLGLGTQAAVDPVSQAGVLKL